MSLVKLTLADNLPILVEADEVAALYTPSPELTASFPDSLVGYTALVLKSGREFIIAASIEQTLKWLGFQQLTIGQSA